MYEFFTTTILGTQIPTAAAMGVGAVGLIAGAAFAAFAARDKLDKARRLMAIAIRYESEADRTYAKIRALTDPTQSVPVVELFPPTRMQQFRRSVAEAVERATWRGEKAAQWDDGELRQLIDATAEQPLPTPMPATPYVVPVAEPVRTYEPQVVVFRDRRDPSERVPARERWAPRMTQLLGGPIPVPPLFASIRMPVQRQRPTPLIMAKLPADSTRQYRVKVRAA
jgi:hypothetical protein